MVDLRTWDHPHTHPSSWNLNQCQCHFHSVRTKTRHKLLSYFCEKCLDLLLVSHWAGTLPGQLRQQDWLIQAQKQTSMDVWLTHFSSWLVVRWSLPSCYETARRNSGIIHIQNIAYYLPVRRTHTLKLYSPLFMHIWIAGCLQCLPQLQFYAINTIKQG